MAKNSTDPIPELVEANNKKFDDDYNKIVSYLKWKDINKSLFDYSGKTNEIGKHTWLYNEDMISYKKAGDFCPQDFRNMFGDGLPDYFYNIFTAMEMKDLHNYRGMSKAEHRRFIKKTDKKIHPELKGKKKRGRKRRPRAAPLAITRKATTISFNNLPGCTIGQPTGDYDKHRK